MTGVEMSKLEPEASAFGGFSIQLPPSLETFTASIADVSLALDMRRLVGWCVDTGC